jgi:hypothetical protein
MALTGHSTAALDSYSDALCADPELVALRNKVTVTADDGLSETQAEVTLTLTNGQSLNTAHDLNAPIALSDRETRLLTKASALIGADKAQTLWQAINTSASARDMGRLIAS